MRVTLAEGEGARRTSRHQPTIEVGSCGDEGDFVSEGEAEDSKREMDERREDRSMAAGEAAESAKPA